MTALPQLTEQEFTRQIRDLATTLGYRRHHHFLSKWSEPGFPDEWLIRPPRLIIAELKVRKNKLSQAQVEWLDDLAACHLEVYVWRPERFDAIVELLRPRARPAPTLAEDMEAGRWPYIRTIELEWPPKTDRPRGKRNQETLPV